MPEPQAKSERPTRYFERCRCPHCRVKLDDLADTARQCPRCQQGFDAHDVWSTRRYPGLLILPAWVSAFGWPLVLIASGFALALVQVALFSIVDVRGPAALVGAGAGWFFTRTLFGGDE